MALQSGAIKPKTSGVLMPKSHSSNATMGESSFLINIFSPDSIGHHLVLFFAEILISIVYIGSSRRVDRRRAAWTYVVDISAVCRDIGHVISGIREGPGRKVRCAHCAAPVTIAKSDIEGLGAIVS